MASTYKRSLVKGIVWEGFAFILTLAAVYMVYGDIGSSAIFTLELTAVKMVLFFAHERIWKKIKWGKY